MDADSFDHTRYLKYRFDYETVEQAIGNILDNAGKYGRPGSTVIIRGGVSSTERLFISVENEGIPISKADLVHIGKRGYRARAAKGIGLEGQGIGLWLVKEMLAPQKGELQIIHHADIHRTEFRIAFLPSPTRPYIKTMNFLLLEDDDHWAGVIAAQIKSAFPKASLTHCATEWAFRALLERRPLPHFDLALFDIMVRWADYFEITEKGAMDNVPTEVELEFEGKEKWRAGVRCRRLFLDLLAGLDRKEVPCIEAVQMGDLVF